MRLIVIAAVGVVALGLAMAFYFNAGYSEPTPPTPQFVEVYVSGSPSAAAVSLTANVTPGSGSNSLCRIEDAVCNIAIEQLTVQVTPKSNASVNWLLVVDTPPLQSKKTTSPQMIHVLNVSPPPGGSQQVGFPMDPRESKEHEGKGADAGKGDKNEQQEREGVWVYQGSVDSQPVTYTAQFELDPVNRPSNHLVIEMPDLLNEVDPSAACGPQAQFVLNSNGLIITPAALGNAICTPTVPSPGTAISYYAPEGVTATEVLQDHSQLKGFTLDSSDNATPIPKGFDWTGSYQLQPAVYATNIKASGDVLRNQLFAGIFIGLFFAAVLSFFTEVFRS